MTQVKVKAAGVAEQAAEQPAAAELPDTCVDSTGRTLRVKEPNVLQESRLVKMLGADATNQVYFGGYVLPACMVTAIDGEKFEFPNSVREIEAQINRLGREGLVAVMKHIAPNAGAVGEEAQRDEIKN